MIPTSPVNRLVELTLRLIGLWPGNAYAFLHRFVWATTMCSTLVFQYWYLVIHLTSGDLPDLMDCLSITLSNSVFFFKLIILWIKTRVLNDIFQMMTEDWKESSGTSKNFETMTSRVILSYRFSSFFVGSYAIGVVFFLSFGLFAEEKQLILKMELPFDATRSPVYELVNIVQFVHEFMAASTSGMLSALLVTLILHVDGQVNIICRQLSEISSLLDNRKSCKTLIKSSIYKHQRVITFADNVENIFTYIALIQFLSNTLVICSLGFVIVTSLDSDERTIILIKTVPYYALANVEAFALCYVGEYLSSRSVVIEKAACESPWYELNPSDSKLLLLLIIRCQRGFAITAGKFMNLSMEVFASMLKASGSYVSVLYAMY